MSDSFPVQLPLFPRTEAAAPTEQAYAHLPGADERRQLLAVYPAFLGVAHLARLFGKSARTIRGWLKDGKLPVVEIGKRRFVSRVALEEMFGMALETVPDAGEH